MNLMLRTLKAGLALTAVGGLGSCLRWVTAGSFDSASQQDLASLAAAAIGAVAWTAYGWLVLAIAATVLEQLPGALGRLAGALARRITSAGARALLRSTLGVAAVTPLTLGIAQAASADAPGTHSWAALEKPSPAPLTVREPPGTSYGDRTVEPASQVSLDSSDQRPAVRRETAGRRIAVPDRPTVGAATRYTELRPGKAPQRVTVRPGDSLWSITRTGLGARATDAAIAARWPDWYAANASLIGPDPDHLEPGQVLRMPSTDQEK